MALGPTGINRDTTAGGVTDPREGLRTVCQPREGDTGRAGPVPAGPCVGRGTEGTGNPQLWALPVPAPREPSTLTPVPALRRARR